jgi:hypothetical protein
MITAKYANELVKEFEENKDMILEEIFMSCIEQLSKQIKTAASIGRRVLRHETDQTFLVDRAKDYFTGVGFKVTIEESEYVLEGKVIIIEW